jgi:acyl-CoA reductase-like NAD-dependent aldehyde dehydrogenase
VQDPATGTVIGAVDDMTPAQVEAAVERARRAQPGWQAMGFARRADRMYELRHWLVKNRERVLDVLVKENGKTREDALLAEIFYIADALGFWAKNAPKYLADERVRTHSLLLLGKKVVVRYRPHGVIGVIGPWNYPLTNSFGDCIPALMAGNSVVLKPSEVTPLTNLLMGEAARECGVPQDVFTVITGAGGTGQALVDNADMIMFTGSTASGKKIA